LAWESENPPLGPWFDEGKQADSQRDVEEEGGEARKIYHENTKKKGKKKAKKDSYGIGFLASPLPSSCLRASVVNLLPCYKPSELAEESSIPVAAITGTDTTPK
jgi:hypothetical protein